MNSLVSILGISGFNQWHSQLWLKSGNSDLAPAVDTLFMAIVWVCIISFVLLMVPMFYWVIKYRRRPGVPALRTPNHNTLLEVTWIVVPLIVVTVIFFWGFFGYMNAQVSPETAEQIYVTGKRWAWSAEYANGAQSGESVYLNDRTQVAGVSELRNTTRGNELIPVFVVPAGIPVKFKLISNDVMHSFYMPSMRVKMDLFPNRYTSVAFTPLDSDPSQSEADSITKKPGTPGRDEYIFCAEYCGDNHSEMSAILRVLPPDLYRKTIQEWGDVTNTRSPVAVGKYIHENRGCIQCHSVDGKDGTGPSWKGYYGKPVAFSSESGGKWDLTTQDGWENYIRESILNPQAKIHQGFAPQMPIYAGQIKELEIRGVAAYFRELNGQSLPEDKVVPEPKKK